MTASRSPLLDLAVAEPQGPAGGAVEGRGPDGGVAAHYGRPLPEQRALAPVSYTHLTLPTKA